MSEEQQHSIAAIYNQFIGELNLTGIRLVQTQAHLQDIPTVEEEPGVPISLTDNAVYSNWEGGFTIRQTYRLAFLKPQTKDECGFIECVFDVDYTNPIPLSQEIFEIFRKNNIPLNVWPYFREFTHNLVSRAGLPPLFLPLYKTLPG